MNPTHLERWIWVLIYGGTALSMLGLWSLDTVPRIAWMLLGLGIATVALGMAGIVWRAHMGRQAPTRPPR